MVKSYAIIFSILLALSLSMLPNIGYGQGGVRNRPTISKDVGVGPGLVGCRDLLVDLDGLVHVLVLHVSDDALPGWRRLSTGALR